MGPLHGDGVVGREDVSNQGGRDFEPLGDFTHLPVHAPFIAMVPQWDFLDFLAQFGEALAPGLFGVGVLFF